MSPYEDEDGIDGPFERAMEAARRDDEVRAAVQRAGAISEHDGEVQFRFRVERRTPAHVYVTVWARTLPTATWSRNGELVFRVGEWAVFEPVARGVGFGVVDQPEVDRG